MIKVGLVSDVHATPEPLAEALQRLASARVDLTLCAGDIAGYGSDLARTVELLSAHGCLSVRGNHDSWYLRERASGDDCGRFLASLPSTRQLEIGGRSILLVHGSPSDPLNEGIRLRDEQGAFIPAACAEWSLRLRDCAADILVVGHTHQVFSRKLAETLVVNPGSTCFNHSCMILTLPEGDVELLGLGGQTPVLSWNFGMERRRDGPCDDAWPSSG